MTPQTDRFSFWISFKQSINLMSSDALKLAAYEIMTDYAFWGIEPKQETTPPELLIWFELVRPNIDTSVKYVTYGKTGGRPKKTPLKTPLKTETETEEEKEKELESEGEAQRTEWQHTKEELAEICLKSNIRLTAGEISAIYAKLSGNGWKLSGEPIRDIGAALRYFEQHRDRIGKPKKRAGGFQDQRHYDYDDLEKQLLNAQRGGDDDQ